MKPKFNFSRENLGFTLIELLVVIAIIGLLASVVLVALNSARQKSRDAKRLGDMRQMASALELFFNDYSGYPVANNSAPVRLVPNYITTLPQAPTPPDGSCTILNNPYVYSAGGTSFLSPRDGSTVYATYHYTFCLGGATGGLPSGVRILTVGGLK